MTADKNYSYFYHTTDGFEIYKTIMYVSNIDHISIFWGYGT